MKVKLQSNSSLQLIKIVKEVLDLCLREAKDLVDERVVKKNNEVYVTIDSEKTEEQIKAITEGSGVDYIPLSDTDFCESNESEHKLQKAKLQEVTDEDLGFSIHSIDETSIGLQLKALFSHKQAARVMSGLHDAKFNVTEASVMHEGQKATMLVVTKTFPTGTRKKDLEKFENTINTFMFAVCEVIFLEEKIEDAKERAIKTFDELQNYE